METNNQHEDLGFPALPPSVLEGTLFIERVLSPEGDIIERFLMMQRIEDIMRVFPDGNINIYHDFANENSLRYLSSWDGANAYRAVAAWMYTVGPEVYQQHAPGKHGMDVAGYAAVMEMRRRTPESTTFIRPATKNTGPPQLCGASAENVAGNAQTATFASFQNNATEQPQAYVHPQARNAVPSGLPQAPRLQPQRLDHNDAVKRLMDDEDTSWKGLIPNYRQYKLYKNAYLSLQNPKKGEEMIDLPETDPQFQPYIRDLYLAAQDMSGHMENPRVVCSRSKKLKSRAGEQVDEDEEPAGQFQDSVAVSKVKGLKSLELELLCWEVLEESWAHQQGQSDIPRWAETCSRKPKHYATLNERINACAEAMRISKNTIKSMLNIDFVKRLTYDPRSEVKRKKTNKILNSKRDVQNKAGIFAQAAGLVTVDGQTRSITSYSGQQIAPANPLAQSLTANSAESPTASQQEYSPGVFSAELPTEVGTWGGGVPRATHKEPW